MGKDKYVVVRDCYCEHYLHEKLNYPREGLKELKLYKDDVVELIEEFQNFIGFYYRVNKDGTVYDISPSNLKPLRLANIEKLTDK